MTDDNHAKMKIELDFLSALERGEVVTQMTLKERVGVSVGLINALLKRAVSKGYVKVQQAPYKRYVYYLTPQGFTEKSRLVAAYLENSMDFLRSARIQYAEILDEAVLKGHHHFLLAGGGELAEIALLASLGKKDLSFTIWDAHSKETELSGVPVKKLLSPDDNFDVIIITDLKNAQDTFESLSYKYPQQTIMWPPFLQITPDRHDLIAKQSERNEQIS